jgi:hypothetical protein
VIKHLIKSHRQFFDVSDEIRDEFILFRLIVFTVLSLLLGVEIGFYFFWLL